MKKKYAMLLLSASLFVLNSCLIFYPHYEAMTEDAHTGKENIPSNEGRSESAWTIVVYMAADNDLEAAGIADLNEMEDALYDHKNISLLVLFDRSSSYDTSNGNWTDTRLFEVTKDPTVGNKEIYSKRIDCPELNLKHDEKTELNMSDETVLSQLLVFAREKYPAKRYGLVMWGHGTGWRALSKEKETMNPLKAVAIDDGSDSYMPLTKLHDGIKNGMDGRKLDFIGFDTCFGSEIEEAYELSDCALWFGGSEGVVSTEGWNYKTWLESCNKQFDDGYAMCQAAEEQHLNETENCFAVLNLSKINNLFESFNVYAKSVASLIQTSSIRNQVFDVATQKSKNYFIPGEHSSLFVDLYDLTCGLNDLFPQLKEENQTVQKAIAEAVCVTKINSVTRYPLGICFCMVDENGVCQNTFPDAYINGSNAENQCLFVRNANGYAPSVKNSVTLLNSIFYKTMY